MHVFADWIETDAKERLPTRADLAVVAYL